MSIFDKALTHISVAIQKLVGSNRLKPYEEACLTAWVGAISSEAGGALKRQLNSFDYIERGPQGMVSAFHSLSDPDYKAWENFLFKRKDSGLKVFQGILLSNIGDLAYESGFSIYIHQGRLSTIEFKSPPKQLMKCEGEIQVKKTRCLVQL
ncbi:hypothetical protein Y5S_03743 [Alcanivorax nanhaiticus]|uniref:Uncharacterized protein n=1 Tax=Alcanivorax nanhaiticus TaxID=1177154 RepID=A0A095UFY2_9GAMM|nr:hypothetical protein [Alcanivorax nanhaiticus]KGD61405.1 hypothetical protein Y5S_03743 [Alcanivorax nanhaiticus]